MRVATKTRAFLLLLAALATTMALSFPRPARAYCWEVLAYECDYPNGVYCLQSCPSNSWCSGDPEGTPVCRDAGWDFCCQ